MKKTPEGNRLVRIDDKTWIETADPRPDDIIREQYLDKIDITRRKYDDRNTQLRKKSEAMIIDKNM